MADSNSVPVKVGNGVSVIMVGGVISNGNGVHVCEAIGGGLARVGMGLLVSIGTVIVAVGRAEDNVISTNDCGISVPDIRLIAKVGSISGWHETNNHKISKFKPTKSE